jgi:hypothetical protein
MNRLGAIFLLGLSLSLGCLAQQAKPLYQNKFDNAALDKAPEDLLILDGAFAVKEHQGNKVLELPGAPLDTFGFLFGPTEQDGVLASARFFGTAKGRRYPAVALGLNGAGGYKLQVNPAKKSLQLYRGDNLKTEIPYEWESGKWTHLRLQVVKGSAGWKIEGKAWNEGKDEPADWVVSAEDKDDLPAGRASISASPFSGMPIRFDDLAVMAVTRK